jgi:hypothetical protein
VPNLDMVQVCVALGVEFCWRIWCML